MVLYHRFILHGFYLKHFDLKKEPHFNQNVEKQSYIDFECLYCLQYLSVVFKVGSEGDMA